MKKKIKSGLAGLGVGLIAIAGVVIGIAIESKENHSDTVVDQLVETDWIFDRIGEEKEMSKDMIFDILDAHYDYLDELGLLGEPRDIDIEEMA